MWLKNHIDVMQLLCSGVQLDYNFNLMSQEKEVNLAIPDFDQIEINVVFKCSKLMFMYYHKNHYFIFLKCSVFIHFRGGQNIS